MAEIPKDTALDSTPKLFSEGYNFIRNQCKTLNTDVFEARILLQKTICMRGEEAAKLFYDTTRFKREKAAPKRLQKTLFGEGGVQTLDGEVHNNRKHMFMTLMSRENMDRLISLVDFHWDIYLIKWQTMEDVPLFEEVEEILCRAVCQWADVPLKEEKVKKRTRQLSSLIESAGEVALGHLEGRWNRKKAEKWLGKLIQKVRSGQVIPSEETALSVISWHKDIHGNLLDEQIAAVELLNILRPTIAVARYIIFLAHALYQHPTYKEKLKQDDLLNEWFVQEVRRFYPFFPFAAAKVKEDFDWNGFHFPKGRRVLLDLYSTDHQTSWEDPEVFRPERFKDWNRSAYNFIPQGGGDHYKNHRCPGEWITIDIMKLALKYLTIKMNYEVPEQDLNIDMTKFPTIPESRFKINHVKRT